MRVDYVHTGGPASGETVALDRVVNDGPWPGSRTQFIDGTNLGKYLFEVRDASSGRVLYSRGFASIYGEWETTAEVKTSSSELSRVAAVPLAQAAGSRDAAEAAARQPLRDNLVDRRGSGLPIRQRRAAARARGDGLERLRERPGGREGRPAGDQRGLHPAQLPKFHKDVARLVDALFAEEPFKSRKRDFNVRALDLPSAESGVNRPNAGVFRRTPLSAEYNIFDSERYVLTLDNRALRDAASAAPYEFVEILVNERTYGGGGIFNDHATAAVDSAFAEYVFVHEFGHHFAALADEYYTSDVAYETGADERSRSRGSRTSPRSRTRRR